jgi:shikimate kinase
MKKPKRNIYLIGMMGTGKSTIGEKVARQLSINFYDSDREIEKKEGNSVSEIFAQHGELKFRELEEVFIESGHPESNCIVSCGGGLCMIYGMLEKLKEMGLVVCLWADAEVIFERIKGDKGRPLLLVKEPKREIQKIIDARKDTYLQADLVINCNNVSIRDVAGEIVDVATNLN